jgi:hypothetical protein
MVNTLDLILLGMLERSSQIPLKGTTMSLKGVSTIRTNRASAYIAGFPDLNSKDTACGARSNEFTSDPIQTWPVQAGKDVTVLWDQWPIAHKGPILEYMAACPSSEYHSPSTGI